MRRVFISVTAFIVSTCVNAYATDLPMRSLREGSCHTAMPSITHPHRWKARRIPNASYPQAFGDKNGLDFVARRVSSDITGAVETFGTRIHWFNPPILLNYPLNQVDTGLLLQALNIIVDTIPLESEVYVPTVDRLSSQYEGALYNPKALSLAPLTPAESNLVSSARKYIFSKYDRDYSQELTPSVAFQTALKRLDSSLTPTDGVTPVSLHSDQVENILASVIDKYNAWNKENIRTSTYANILSDLYRKGNADFLRRAKTLYEANQDVTGTAISQFSPPVADWFVPQGWRLASTTTSTSFWLKEVTVIRPWFDLNTFHALLKLIQSTEERGRNAETGTIPIQEMLVRKEAVSVPVGLILLADGDPASEKPNSVRLLAVIVQTTKGN